MRNRILPIFLLLLLAVAVFWRWQGQQSPATEGWVSASGTVEAMSVSVAAEMPARVLSIAVNEGEVVAEGDELVQLDTAMIEGQRRQAEAALSAAQAQHAAAAAAVDAAEAQRDLLAAGATDAQRDLADTTVQRAEAARESLQAAVDALPVGSEGSANALLLQQQLTLAQASLDQATAQQATVADGARPEQLAAADAQVDAAQAHVAAAQSQVEAAQAALELADLQRSRATLVAPISGVVLRRLIEPGELAMSGATLIELADLSQPTLTVYLSQDDLGSLQTGGIATVRVDAYPDEQFVGTIRHIANRAEFTPRNAQTDQGRSLTVFAVEVALDNPEGKLKPGMVADVYFE